MLDKRGTHDLAWWRLGDSVSIRVRVALYALISAVGGATALALAWPFGAGFGAGFGVESLSNLVRHPGEPSSTYTAGGALWQD